MPEDKFTKDYSGYFEQIENSLQKEKSVNSNTIRKTTYTPKHKKKKGPYKVVKLNVVKFISFLLAICILIGAIVFFAKSCKDKDSNTKSKTANESVVVKKDDNTTEKVKIVFPKTTDNTIQVDAEITSENVIVVNNETNEIVASRNATVKAYPASTTKLMTLLVAVENLEDFENTFTMTYEITDPLFAQEATVAGFLSGETVNMSDLLYGTILPSGADAAIGLAQTISGSEAEFVKLMNKKVKELKLKNTNFTNCTGLYDANHYTTAEDMAVIMKAVLSNSICKEIISTYRYTTSVTTQHPEGILLENTIFKYMYGTEPEGAQILGGKTGYTGECGYCICSYGKSESGTEYIAVTLKGLTRWPAVYDQINIYTKYAN